MSHFLQLSSIIWNLDVTKATGLIISISPPDSFLCKWWCISFSLVRLRRVFLLFQGSQKASPKIKTESIRSTKIGIRTRTRIESIRSTSIDIKTEVRIKTRTRRKTKVHIKILVLIIRRSIMKRLENRYSFLAPFACVFFHFFFLSESCFQLKLKKGKRSKIW